MKSFIFALCDNDEHTHKEIDRLIKAFCDISNIGYTIYHYYSTEKLLNTDKNYGCLLLDIEMPGIDGIAAAKLLRRQHKNFPIIILTSHNERYKEAFEIQAFRFVTKPISQKELFCAFNAVIAKNAKEEKITVYRDRIPYTISVGDILYIEGRNSHSIIYTNEYDYRSEYTLKKWEMELNTELFYRCHKSYIVNLSQIVDIENNIAILINDERITISKRNHTGFLRTYLNYNSKYR